MAAYGMRPSGQFGGLAELGGAPIIVVQDQEEKRRLKGYEAHKTNIMAAIEVASLVRTSFGPKGMDKIIVGQDGDITVTNDGATILKKMPVDHECARLLVDLSQSQDDQVGDGTTGVVILAGALLQASLKLLDKKIHPLKIANGFELACNMAVEKCETLARTLEDATKEDLLRKAAMTALCSKVVSSQSAALADICVKACLSVADLQRQDVNFDLIKVEGKPGGRLEDTKLIDGIAVDKDFSHSQMKKEIHDAKIAILTCPFEPPKPKTKHKLSIKSSDAYKELQEQEQQYFKDQVDLVKKSGATLVVCQWGFDDEANHLLMKNELPAIRWMGGQEIELISLATGAQIVPRFEDLRPEKLGMAKLVKEITVGTEDDKMILIEGCPKGKSVTILIRGGNAMMISEAKRCVHDAICVIRNLITDPRIVPGGGAIEAACSLHLAQSAQKISTIDQFAVEAFAEALMAIPEALGENSGMDTIKLAGEIRQRQLREANSNIGVDCINGRSEDMFKAHVYESLNSKIHQYALATQVVKMILKIDDVIVHDEQQMHRHT